MPITEFASWSIRWLALSCGTLCLGTLAFHLLLASPSPDWARRWRRIVRAAAIVWFCVGFLALSNVVARATGEAHKAWNLSAWQTLIFTTRFGAVWLSQQTAIALLALMLAIGGRLTARSRLVVAAALSALALGASACSGHAAALEPAWPAMLGNAIHLIAVGVWLGALPALISLLAHAGAESSQLATQALRRFSSLALLCVCIVLASGVPLADLQIERIPALIGTRYGYALLIKLALIAGMLLLAARVRWRVLPQLGTADDGSALRRAAWTVVIECGVGLLVLACAALLAQTIPARHDAIAWPFAFRFSIDATWPDRAVREKVNLGLLLIAAAILWAWITFSLRSARRIGSLIAALLASAGLYLALPALTVDAYPDTYRRTTVPYHVISIASGARLYSAHCASCHGAGARGDGAAGRLLPMRPADLTEPHTALHTAGDLFWWLTHGKSAGAMPAFAARLSEDERWDLINYLRVLSAGYQARILSENISPGRPWLAAPDISFMTLEGEAATLKDYRGRRAILLLMAHFPAAEQRLAQLSAIAPKLNDLDVQVLVLPTRSDLPARAQPFTVMVDGAREAALAYSEFRRSLTDMDARNERPLPEHMELLIDRYGYIRARWLPNESLPGWYAAETLLRQLELLRREPPTAPADDHVH